MDQRSVVWTKEKFVKPALHLSEGVEFRKGFIQVRSQKRWHGSYDGLRLPRWVVFWPRDLEIG